MALPPGSPDMFSREVDDAVRADRAADFVQKYGRILLGVIVIALFALAAWLFWQSREKAAAGERGTQLSSALDSMGQGRPKAAAAAADALAKGEDGNYRALALMLQGNAAQAQGDLATAAARFGAAAGTADGDQILRDVALLRQMLSQFDSLPPATVIARLRHLVATPGPAFASAAELTALAELKRGNDRAAGLLYKRIVETDDVSESLKSRAVQMAGMLGVDAVSDSNAATQAAAVTKSGE